MADSKSSTYDAAIRDFKTKLKECTVVGACGRQYVLVSKFTKWMKSTVRLRSGDHFYETKQAERLLQAVYQPPRWDRIAPPIDVSQLLNGPQRCLLVFSILLELGLGHQTHVLWRRDQVDIHLPISSLDILKKPFQDMNLDDPEGWARAFDEIQWRFRPVQFELNMGREYDDMKQVLPVLEKQPINLEKGGTAKLWQIVVLDEFVGKDLKEAVKNSVYDPKDYPGIAQDNLGPRYQLALKVFDEGNKLLFENEKYAFKALHDHGGMVRYLGEYTHREKRMVQAPQQAGATGNQEKVTKTYNILLEFAECDLDELFIERSPPVLPNEIEAFWKNLLDVANALEQIHNLKRNEGVVKEYLGWHADIKPDNILIIEEEDASGITREKFKLADPGFAKFVEKTGEDGKVVLIGGRKHSVCAPERHKLRRDTLSTQKVDTWSLGCVFSIAATWVVLGHEGIKQYNQLRKKAIRRIIAQQNDLPELPKASRLNPGDYFHDGVTVLDEVRDWHIFLRNALRRTDTITSRVIDLTDESLLRGDVVKRVTAKELCYLLRKILADPKTDSQLKMPDSVVRHLFEVDQEAPTKVKSLLIDAAASKVNVLDTVQDRKARKSKFLAAPLMKTANRSEYLKSELAERSIVPALPNTSQYPIPSIPPQINIHGDMPVIQEPAYGSDPNRQSQSSTINGAPSHFTPPPVLRAHTHSTLSKRNSFMKKAPISPPQDVFQAREEIMKGQSFFRRSRKDKLLSLYFEERDIKFLVDNAYTMADAWFQTSYLLETLVMKAKGQDDNGMDLNFTIGPVKVDGSNDKEKFTKAMEKARPGKGMQTDMRIKLVKILNDYLLAAKRANQMNMKVKNLTLIILTDGIWEGTSNKDEVGFVIANFLKELMKVVNDHGNRPVSIEFVQFGDDPNATYRLRSLDNWNDLKSDGSPDVIDTEHCTGDVNKMLLGSFVQAYDDNDNDDDSSTIGPGSPSNQSQIFGGFHQSHPQ